MKKKKKKYLKEWDDWGRIAAKLYYEPKKRDAGLEVENLIALVSDLGGSNYNVHDWRILDVGAGWGRHTLELYKRGIVRTVAIDASPFMRELFQKELSKVIIDVGRGMPEYIHDDFMNYSPKDEFDLVIMLWSMFGVCDDHEENFAVLSKSASVLRRGGRLVIETVLRDKLSSLFASSAGAKLAFTFDTLTSQIEHWERRQWEGVEWLILGAMSLTDHGSVLRYSLSEWPISDCHRLREGRARSGTISLRYYDLGELVAMLSDAGFAVERVYGPLVKPKNLFGPRGTVIARRL